MEGDPKAWVKMKRYCVQDVNLTEKNYKVLRPWIHNHPNLTHYSRDIKACSACGKQNTLFKRGTFPAGQRRRQRYRCEPEKGGCGKWCAGELIPQNPDTKLLIVK
jgi:predicted acyl esterase